MTAASAARGTSELNREETDTEETSAVCPSLRGNDDASAESREVCLVETRRDLIVGLQRVGGAGA